MTETMIRDQVGRIIGYYRDEPGRIVLLSPVRKEIGFYDKKRNETWRSYPREIVSRQGNTLGILIGQ